MGNRRSVLEMAEHERMREEGKLPPSDEFVKGEISGIRLFLHIPEIVMESAAALIKQEEGSDDNGNEDDRNSDA